MGLHKFGYSNQPEKIGMNHDEIGLLKEIEEECKNRGIDFDSFINKVNRLRKR